jgi:hypothetical protein
LAGAGIVAGKAGRFRQRKTNNAGEMFQKTGGLLSTPA